jgi:hypothetical protein
VYVYVCIICIYTFTYINTYIHIYIGSFGLRCLEEYQGDYLVLVGEWQVYRMCPLCIECVRSL